MVEISKLLKQVFINLRSISVKCIGGSILSNNLKGIPHHQLTIYNKNFLGHQLDHNLW